MQLECLNVGIDPRSIPMPNTETRTCWPRAEDRNGRGGTSRRGRRPRRSDPPKEPKLTWFFAQGRNPNLRTPELRKRWRRISRALDGSGYSLMLHCTGEGRPERATLWREYRRFKDNLKRPKRGLFFVATYDSLLEVLNSDKSDDDRLRTLPIPVHQYRSTWGDIRVDAGLARLFLELTFGISMTEARSLDDEEALEMLRYKVACVHGPAAGAGGGDGGEDRYHEGLLELSEAAAERQCLRRQEQEAAWREAVRKALGAGAWFDGWSQGGIVRRTWWRSRAPLLETGAGTTSVTRLAKILSGVRPAWIRRCLQKLACPGCTERGSRMPLPWFASERGHDFWAWAESQVIAIDRARAAVSRRPGRYQRS